MISKWIFHLKSHKYFQCCIALVFIFIRPWCLTSIMFYDGYILLQPYQRRTKWQVFKMKKLKSIIDLYFFIWTQELVPFIQGVLTKKDAALKVPCSVSVSGSSHASFFHPSKPIWEKLPDHYKMHLNVIVILYKMHGCLHERSQSLQPWNVNFPNIKMQLVCCYLTVYQVAPNHEKVFINDFSDDCSAQQISCVYTFTSWGWSSRCKSVHWWWRTTSDPSLRP